MGWLARTTSFFLQTRLARDLENMATPNLPTIRFPWRMAIYGIAILYIALDMYVFHGPLSKMIDRMQGRGIEEQIAKVPTGLVATVNTWPITVADVERGVWEYCTLRGLEAEEIDARRMEVIRAVVLGNLIDDLAVWHFARLNPVPVEEAEIDAAIAQVRGHFASDEDFAERLAAQGFDAGRFREYIADQVHQRKYLEAKAANFITVSDAEIEKWYESDAESRIVPERWRARQIFMATLDKDAAVVGEKIKLVAAALGTGEITFEEAVKAHSEDARSKKTGGDLGYFSRDRMPEDFMGAITSQGVGKLGSPFQTKLGWHLAEVTDHRPKREAGLDEMRAEIRAHLESQKREDVIGQIVRDLRRRSKIWPPEPKPHAILGETS